MKTLNQIILMAFISFVALQLYSCITSFHPLFTAATISTDDKVAGDWNCEKGELKVQKVADSKDSDIFNLNISREDSVYYTKFYIITLKSGEYAYSWSAGIVNINNEEFISMTADDCLNSNNEAVYPKKDKGYEYLNSYTIAKLVWKNKNEIELHFLNGNYIRQNILQNKVRIKHEYDNLYNTFIITASTNEMVEFLKKYGNDERLYGKTYNIILKRQA